MELSILITGIIVFLILVMGGCIIAFLIYSIGEIQCKREDKYDAKYVKIEKRLESELECMQK